MYWILAGVAAIAAPFSAVYAYQFYQAGHKFMAGNFILATICAQALALSSVVLAFEEVM